MFMQTNTKKGLLRAIDKALIGCTDRARRLMLCGFYGHLKMAKGRIKEEDIQIAKDLQLICQK